MYAIDLSYPDGLFWALGIVIANTGPTQPAGLHGIAHRCTVSISLFGHANFTAVESWFKSHRRRVPALKKYKL